MADSMEVTMNIPSAAHLCEWQYYVGRIAELDVLK